jgi:ABC-type nitrate/sulfonate/bicarbonate transport system permease component
MPVRDGAVQRAAIYAVSLALGAALWEAAGRQVIGSIGSAFLPRLSTTIARIYENTLSGALIGALQSSLLLFFTGLAFAIVVGVAVGLLLARVRTLRVALEPYIMVLYATPMVALIPFILSMLGFGFSAKALTVFLFAVFPILYTTIEGARSLKPEMLEVAQSFRSSEWGIWRDVLVPYTVPFVMTGIRLAIGRGLVGMVAAEFFLSGSGLGLLIFRSGQDFDVPGIYAGIIVITILGVALMAVGRVLENRVAAWRGLDR